MVTRTATPRTLPVVCRVAALLVLILVVTTVQAQCDLSQEPTRLSVEGFGTAYFQEFETDAARNRVDLSGGVCITGEDARWTILAESASLSGLRNAEQLRAEIIGAVLLYKDWRVVAEMLRSDGVTLEMEQVTFSGRGVVGSAAVLALDLRLGRTVAGGVRVLGRSFRLEAESAELVGDAVDLRTVLITTCTCPGRPFYVVTGSEAHLELDAQRLDVGNGYLSLAGLRLPLAPEFQLSGAAFEELSLPVTLEYRPGNSGTGLGVVVPDLELDEGLSLEMGLLGLDDDNPLQAFALAHYRSKSVNFTVGRARGGPRADLVVVEPLAPALDASFAIRNRHEAASDYLHEGVLSLAAKPAAVALGQSSKLNLSGELFAAASAQEIAGTAVVSPRLGALAGVELAVPTGPGATMTVGLEGRLTDYPALNASQFGVSLRSGWLYRRGPWTLDLRHNRLWTDSGSPFSVKLDRLLPQNEVELHAAVAGAVAGSLTGNAHLDLEYDLLMVGNAVPNGLERLGAAVSLSYPLGGWTMGFRGNLELAGLLDPDPPGRRRAFVQTEVTAEQGDWEAGAKVRYDLRSAQQGLSLLEASVAVPLEYKGGTLTPYVALDFAPTLLRHETPRLSGHGVTLTWRSCCGTVKVGYRQQDSSFATTFGFALEH